MGPLFTHHLATSPAFSDFEVGVPVDAVVSPAGRVRPGALPAARVARTVYHGDYDGLWVAWKEFGERVQTEFGTIMAREGLAPGETLWERYLAGPESDPDPAAWRTELNRPLRRTEP
ncbi:MAG: GyrI-like domain-containing protein [Gemmatimonadetes bacterium]|nr:GyrI-like domain-containing protein [Gemmatimonadota bacterium]